MAVTRHNILSDTVDAVHARQQYIKGAKLLKEDFLGATTADFIANLPGPPQPVSTYDLFIIWHHAAMSVLTPPLDGLLVTVPQGTVPRNAAHGGPIFLPWHRFMLILFEQQLQRVLADTEFGLPYWDWAADGELPPSKQTEAKIWGETCMGGGGDFDAPEVPNGPFSLAEGWRVRIAIDVNARLVATDRSLLRFFRATLQPGTDLSGLRLPTKAALATAFNKNDYDAAPWDDTSTGFRNHLEGWVGNGLHNRVHFWIGGDMWPSTSPNDPVFYLNHCNIDRIWAAWQEVDSHTYLPDQTESNELRGHRIDDSMHALLSPPFTTRQMLDAKDLYRYDTLDMT